MAKWLHHDRLMWLFTRALEGGARRLSMSACEWDISGNCLLPYRTEYVGRPRTGPIDNPDKFFVFEGKKMTMRVDILTRCGRCEPCGRARAAEWRIRTQQETARAARTWFGTLTLRPDLQYRMLEIARANAGARAIPWDELDDDQRFKRQADASLKEVTKYLKRVRAMSNVPLRYVCVTEKHKSGLPHFHLLVHEVELRPVTHRILSSQWRLGFEKWRLIPFDNLKTASYLCKYLTKTLAVRVRASKFYGQSQATVGAAVTSIRQIDDLGRNEQSEV